MTDLFSRNGVLEESKMCQAREGTDGIEVREFGDVI